MSRRVARQIEELLVRHYLSSDGPYGSSPIRFIDVTEEELCIALSEVLPDADIKEALINSFDPQDVKEAFSSGHVSTIGSDEVPGWFRYLVLSCVVFSLSEEDVESFDFGHRMQHLFGISVPNRVGLRHLWGRLDGWLETRNERGLPFRRISLPNVPESMRNIGFSAYLTFPSWRDVARLQRLFEGVAEEDLRRPAKVIARIAQSTLGGTWSPGFLAAFQEFKLKAERGLRLIATHPFFSVVRRAARTGPLQVVEETRVARVDLSTDADGYNEYQIVDGGQLDYCYAHFDEVARDIDCRSLNGPYRGLVRSLNEGIVPFEQGETGNWRSTREPNTPRVRLAVRKDVAAGLGLELDELREWGLTPPLSWERTIDILRRVRPSHDARGEAEIIEPLWEGGVRVGRNAFLGRPDFLPSLTALPNLSVTVVARRVDNGNLTFAGQEGSTYFFSANDRLHGTWDIRLEEQGEFAGDVRLSLMPDAHEHDFSAGRSTRYGWLPEPGLSSPLAPSYVRHVKPNIVVPKPRALEDLLEAVYSPASSRWSQRELIEILSRYFCRRGAESVRTWQASWEALQVLSGAGWISPTDSTTWRSRCWSLMPPRLVHWPESRCVLLEGAAGAVVVRRFEAAVQRQGGTLGTTAGPGFCIPLPWACVEDASALADEMGLSLVRPSVDLPRRGEPAQLMRSSYTSQSRSCTATWSWEARCFQAISYSRPTSIDRTVLLRLRHNADRSPDVYLVKGGGQPDAYYDSPRNALIDAHRREKVALFQLDVVEGVVRRIGSAGSLPEPFERLSRYRHLQSPSLVLRAGRCLLQYPLAAKDVPALSEWLGDAAEVIEPQRERSDAIDISDAILARRRKLRPETICSVRRSS